MGKKKNKSKKIKQQDEADIFGCNTEGLGVLASSDLLDELDSMDPTERQYFMEELSVRSDFWDESGVFYE